MLPIGKRKCSKCGGENDVGATFCAYCGASLQPMSTQTTTSPPSYPSSVPQPIYGAPIGPMERPLGVVLLAILQVIAGIFTLLSATLIATFLNAPGFGLFLAIVGIITIIIGAALFTGHNAARILVMIGAVLDILTIVGIPWGVVLLIYFRRRNVVAYFHRNKMAR